MWKYSALQTTQFQPYKPHNFRSISEGKDSPTVNQDSIAVWQYSGNRVIKFYLPHPLRHVILSQIGIAMCLFVYHCMSSAWNKTEIQ